MNLDATDEGAALDDDDRRELLRIARLALLEWFTEGRSPAGVPHREALLSPRSVFVTVEVDRHLRGCVGRIDPLTPLYRTVADLAVSAATADSRFDPVCVDELDRTQIEISVLAPRRHLTDPQAIQIGVHGLVATRGARRGLLLPRVAVEHAWNAETFLGETCKKAGLPNDAWRHPDTVVETFTAQVFSEPG